NAQYPEQIRELKPITQLYLSLDATNPTLLKEVDVPLFKDYWERLNASLDAMADKKQRTCIRLTLIKDLNMIEPEKYAELIQKSDTDFIEVKAYMFVGASRDRLKLENMPRNEEVVAFTKELMQYLPGYEIVSEHFPSRVVMVAKKKFKKNGKWHTWIDFKKFDELVRSGKDFTTDDYLALTPQTGLSGEETLASKVKIDEKTQELEFWTGKED
ncbi:MAG: hypothetical protein GOV15_02705, partial [Candidatus Diapherotrites archaeon]|nr:hypothetical protein [Candidatus Diapherotrites archaeon]